MQIIDKRQEGVAAFEDILEGECFVDRDGRVIIKADKQIYDLALANGINLQDGTWVRCDGDEPVEKVNAKIVIE